MDNASVWLGDNGSSTAESRTPSLGLKMLFVSSRGKKGSVAPFTHQQEQALKKAGVDVDHFEIKEKGLLGYWRAIRELREHLMNNPVPLIHAHYSYCGWVADLARRKEKLVVSFLGSDIFGFSGAGPVKRAIWSIIKALTCLHARFRVDLSIVMSIRMRQVCGMMGQCEVLSDGVDFERYYPVDRDLSRQKLGWPLDKKIVLFPGNPKRAVKNYPLAEATVAELHDDQVLLKAFEMVPAELMNDYYNAADVCLLTSRHEGGPCVVKEAMACNLPVVSTDVGDVREVVSNTEGCAVCDPEPRRLAPAVASVFEHCKRSNGREQISHLEVSAVGQKQIELYRQVLACKR